MVFVVTDENKTKKHRRVGAIARVGIRNGALLWETALFNSRETANYAKKSFDVCLKRIKKTGERTCCPWSEIIRLKELCTHMDIIVERLRRRPLFLYNKV